MRFIILCVLPVVMIVAGSPEAKASRDAEVYWTTFANGAEIGASLCIGAMTDIRNADFQEYFHNYKIVLASQWRGFKTFFRGELQGSPYLRGLIESEGYWESLEGCFGEDPEKWVRFTNMMIYSEGLGAVASFVIPLGIYRYLSSIAGRIPLVARFLERTRRIQKVLQNPYTVGFLSLGFALKKFGPFILKKISIQNLAQDPERFIREIESNSKNILDEQAEVLSVVLQERSEILRKILQDELLKPAHLQDASQIESLQEQIEEIEQTVAGLKK